MREQLWHSKVEDEGLTFCASLLSLHILTSCPISHVSRLNAYLSEVAIEYPEGIIKQVLYPVVGEQTLKDLVKEYKSTGLAYRQRVHTVMRSSYASHYRRMVPQILEVLEFRSSNDVHRPVIQALELLKK